MRRKPTIRFDSAPGHQVSKALVSDNGGFWSVAGKVNLSPAAYKVRPITRGMTRFSIPRVLNLSCQAFEHGVVLWPLSVRAPVLASNFSRAK